MKASVAKQRAKVKSKTKAKAKSSRSGTRWPTNKILEAERKATAAENKAKAAILERNEAVDRAIVAEARARAAELCLTAPSAKQLLETLGDMNKNEATFVINKLQRAHGL